MKLIAHVIEGHKVEIRPASPKRNWMEATDQRFAYRCLPLNIANACGWEILCNAGFTAIWTGDNSIEAVSIEPDPNSLPPVLSHFGHGILTFHLPCVFRTGPGESLMIQGPINRPKDGISALSGVIETDWAPYSFTMNWIFTRPGVAVRFEKDEPYCQIFPLRCDDLESTRPELRLLSEAPELKRQHELWTESRKRFNDQLKQRGSKAQYEKWQKLYQRGLHPEGHESAPENHRTRLKLKPFRKTSEE